jgi:hypothetical protein
MFRNLAIAGCVLASVIGFAQGKNDVRINQIQIIGSHNSYHVGLTPGVKALLLKDNPKSERGLDYSHKPIPTQLDAGVRQLEIDIYADSKGGLYSHPAAAKLIEQMGYKEEPYNTDGAMDKPGFKVMHIQDVDQHSSCITLRICLEQVLTWSNAHPRHVPIFILLEGKFKPVKLPGAVTPEPFTPAVFDELDKELRSIVPADKLITPDQVRGSYATMPEAIAHGGWPTLEQSRGKIVFLLDNRVLTPTYIEGHPALKGRVIFSNSVPGDPDAAFTEENSGTEEHMDELAKQGYLIRTRADADTEQARTNDTSMRDKDFRSGAQIISTDYFSSEPAKWPGHYVVEFPGNIVARCNPIDAPKGCPAGDLEK